MIAYLGGLRVDLPSRRPHSEDQGHGHGLSSGHILQRDISARHRSHTTHYPRTKTGHLAYHSL